MKQTKYIFAAALAMLALGCNKEQVVVDGTPDGEEVGVTFTAELPGMQAKAIGDGLTAKNLIVEVYEDETGAAGTHIAALHQTATFTALKADVKFSLVKGKTYHFIFWAQADNAPYTLDAAAKTVAISYAGEANDESRDAFYAVKTLKVLGPATEPVQLKRPFAQVNFGTADFDDAKAGGVEVTQSSFTATDAATSLDLFAGEGVGSTDITYTEKELPTEALTLKDGTTYTYMAMNYFVPTGKFAESHVSNVKAQFVSASHAVEISSPSTPVQSNYRTNIVGDILTRSQQFKIVVDPAFDEPDNNVVYRIAKASTQAEMTAAAAQPNTTVVLEPNTYTLSAAPADGVVFTSNNPETTIIRIPAAVTATNVKFENVTVESPNANYTGIQHATSVRYVGCIITGQPFSYAADAYYDNCTFKQTSSSAYNIWTYGSTRITFNKCEFQCAGKSVLIYNEGTVRGQTATFNDCTFTASAPASGKAAIEIDSSLPVGEGTQFNVIINNCTATGFDNGSVSHNSLWNEKKGTKAQVTVDGVVVKERQ